MNYQDFVLQLDRAPAEQGFVARVLRSPAGEAEAPFVNPVSPTELDNLWQAAHEARQAHRYHGVRDLGTAPPSHRMDPLAAELAHEELGDRLFKALFHGPVRSCWARSLDESTRVPDGGLRLKLQLNLTDPLVAPLAELPWEYLFSQEQGGFLGLQRQTPILRHLRLPLPAGRALTAQTLRVLIVSSQPGSMTPLSLEAESKKISDALGTLPGVETHPLENPTVETLRETLLQKDFHVLHFMGHGGFDSASGQGVLYFAGGNGTSLPVSGALLASHLAGLYSLRLVFINACDTARSNARAPFAGVSTALLRAGLPAVVAMQRPIPDGSALEFSRVVYRRLATGDPIDAAVTEGRLAIARGRGALLEWGTPVLFLRAEDGSIFTPEAAAVPVEPPAPVPPEAPPASPAPIPAPQSRPLRLFLLAGIITAGIGIGVTQWPFGGRMEPAPSGQDSLVSDQQATPTPISNPKDVTSDSPLQSSSQTEETPAPPKPKPKPEPDPIEETQKPIVEKPAPPPPIPKSSYEVSEGSPASVSDLQAEVRVRFFERSGSSFARFSVAPQGQGMLEKPPVMGTGTIEFPAQSGTYHLDVLDLDLAGKRASVRLRFVP